MVAKGEITERVVDYFRSGDDKLPRYYNLHDIVSVDDCRKYFEDEGYPVRDIMSGSVSATERVYKLVNDELTPGMRGLESLFKILNMCSN